MTVQNPDEPGYDKDKYPREVYEVHNLALDMLLSGLDPISIAPDDQAFWPELSQLAWGPRPEERLSFFDWMRKICNEKHGDKWYPVPVEFRVTGVKFAEAGGFKPRLTDKEPLRIHYTSSNGYANVAFQGDVPRVHFYVEGYWVFRCESDNGKKTELYAIATDFKARTTAHSPYDKTFSDGLAGLRDQHNNDKRFVVGRTYDRLWSYDNPEDFQGARLRALQQTHLMLKVGTKEQMLQDIKPDHIIHPLISKKP